MNTEQKARAYDEAIKRAKALIKVADNQDEAIDFTNTIFPELAESKDEMIRKEILEYFQQFKNEGLRGINISDWIAWLEKQGEHANFRNNIRVGDKVTRNEAGVLVNISQLNRIAKPRVTNKIEPKFHEGDIIIHKELGGDYIQNPHKIIQVDILDKKYRLEGGLVAHFGEQDDYELIEQKPAESKQETKPNGGIVYEDFNEGDGYYKVNLAYLSKSQVELIENLVASWQTSANNSVEWSEEDYNKISSIKYLLHELDNHNFDDWFDKIKSLKPQQKQEWSEDDENMLRRVFDSLNTYAKGAYPILKGVVEEEIDWLKSLRLQKPFSEEDKKRIKRIASFILKNRKGDTDEIFQQEQDVKWLNLLIGEK